MGKSTRPQRVRTRGWKAQTYPFQVPGFPELQTDSIIPDKAEDTASEHG